MIKIENAQQLVDLKKRLEKARHYPWTCINVTQLAFLCGIEEKPLILEAISLFYGCTVGFFEEFLTLKSYSWSKLKGMPSLQEAHAFKQHFTGECLMEYSSLFEEEQKRVLPKKEFQGKDLAYILSNYPRTVAWDFEYSVSIMDQFVSEIGSIINGALASDFGPAMNKSCGIEPYILGSLAFHLVKTGIALKSESQNEIGEMYEKLKKNLSCLPLEYVWQIARDSADIWEARILNYSSSGSLLDNKILAALVARKYEPQIATETDWVKMEELYRRFHGTYILRKKVLLRMIELCQ